MTMPLGGGMRHRQKGSGIEIHGAIQSRQGTRAVHHSQSARLEPPAGRLVRVFGHVARHGWQLEV